MWSYLKNPQHVPSVPAGSKLSYAWGASLPYSDNFESNYGWTGLSVSSEFVNEGSFSGLWQNQQTTGAIVKKILPNNWSSYHSLRIWVYSYVATYTPIRLIFNSENPATTGSDYYLYRVF